MRCPLFGDVYCIKGDCGIWSKADGCCSMVALSKYAAESEKYMKEIEDSLKIIADKTYIAKGTCPGHYYG